MSIYFHSLVKSEIVASTGVGRGCLFSTRTKSNTHVLLEIS